MHLTIPEYRTLAVNFARHKCGGAAGMPEGAPTYAAVTEGLDKPPYPNNWSSCGSLVSSVWFDLGIRCSFVNRKQNDRYGYRDRQNISLLSWADKGGVPNSARRTPTTWSRFQPGDVLVIWSKPDTSDAHTFVVLSHEGDELTSADYGQPGGAIRTRTIEARADAPYLVGSTAKRIQRWVPLDFVLNVAEERNELVPPDFSALQIETERQELEPTLPVGLNPDPMLRPRLSLGSDGLYVEDLQKRLKLKVDGRFGPITELTVRDYQRSRALAPDGQVGVYTWGALMAGRA